MFDSFKNDQFVAYSLLNNAIIKDKLSHAYLIDVNNYNKAFDFVMSFIKRIVCGEKHGVDSEECVLCKRIDNNNYSELKIIEAQSSIIKKEQLIDLQNDFSLSSIEGKYRVYIIKDCDKMNKHASNCLLKFLEEPVPGVIAILLTNNFNKILPTIVSRCQIIRFANNVILDETSSLKNLALTSCNTESSLLEFLDDNLKYELIENVLSFAVYFEENRLDTLIYMNHLWYNKFKSREDSCMAIFLLVYFYYDLLKYKLGELKYFFCDKLDVIKKCANFNSIGEIIKKIEIVCYCYEMINCNLNINLLLDDMVIRLGDVNECC